MDLFSNAIEQAHWATLDRVVQKRLGQFWTPYPVARLMAAWMAPTEGDICDPAAGSGVFLRALADPQRPVARGRRVLNYDLDAGMIAQIAAFVPRLTGVQVEAEVRDYFDTPGVPTYGGVIINPPYLKHADIEDKPRLLAEVARVSGVRLNGLSNLYIYFLVRLACQLLPAGRMAIIVPSEFLNSSYGRPVKHFLLERNLLRGIISFDYANSIFDNAMTTAAILLLANDRESERTPIAFLRADSLESLAGYERQVARSDSRLSFGRQFTHEELNPEAQWRHYFDGGRAPAPLGYTELGTFVSISHGVTTGHNGFFVLRPSQVVQLGLPGEWLLPTVGRSQYAQGPIFRQRDWAALEKADKPVWLLNAPEAAMSNPAFAAYAASTLGQEAQARPSLRGRNSWFRLPQRRPAPLWISNLSRSSIKLLRNETQAITLDQFHDVYPRPSLLPLRRLLGAYWLTTEFAAAVRDEAREYGQGLLKIETREVLATPIPDFRRLSRPTIARLVRSDAAFRAARSDGARQAALGQIEANFAAARGELERQVTTKAA